ncbi:MAG: L-threonylcarbamoyladenylate synthase [Thermoprotei archaeon]
MTVVVKLNAINPEPWGVRLGAQRIVEGGLVAFPTETVYGLGANALDGSAARRVFSAKGRPADNPLIVHVSDFEMLREVAEPPPWLVESLHGFWPGPLTVVLPRKERIPDEVTAGLDTVAVRMPAHPVALSLIRESRRPIAAPSANTSTKPSPTRAEHVVEDLWGKVDVVLDGGETFFGVESTIVRVEESLVTVLRPGPYTLEELSKHFPKVEVSLYALGAAADRPVAPGMKYKHYAPTKPLFLAADPQLLVRLSQELSRMGVSHVVLCSSETAGHLDTQTLVLGSRENLYEVAKNLFHVLRVFDRRTEPLGLVEPFDESGVGLAIMNRLRKACGGLVVREVDQIMREAGITQPR